MIRGYGVDDGMEKAEDLDSTRRQKLTSSVTKSVLDLMKGASHVEMTIDDHEKIIKEMELRYNLQEKSHSRNDIHKTLYDYGEGF